MGVSPTIVACNTLPSPLWWRTQRFYSTPFRVTFENAFPNRALCPTVRCRNIHKKRTFTKDCNILSIFENLFPNLNPEIKERIARAHLRLRMFPILLSTLIFENIYPKVSNPKLAFTNLMPSLGPLKIQFSGKHTSGPVHC